MTPVATVQEIQQLITSLIEAGLADQQRYPATHTVGDYVDVGISGAPSLSVSLKTRPYNEIYDALEKTGAYHVRMIDGALLQMLYRFRGPNIVSQRLCLFPAPNLEAYDLAPELYENDELYADIVGRHLVHVPIRFDFDDELHEDILHPKAHLTLGQYEKCRIPVSAPLTPSRFIVFILRNFYSTAFYATELCKIDCVSKYTDTITVNERGISYFSA